MADSDSDAQQQKERELELLREKWSSLDMFSKDSFFQEMRDQKDWKWEDLVDDLVPEVDSTLVKFFFFPLSFVAPYKPE
jgi:hypothetical protein